MNCVIAPGEGSQFLASASDDMTVRVWNVENGECLHVLPHTSKVESLIALGGGGLASAAQYGEVRVWDAMNGVCRRVVQRSWGFAALINGRVAAISKDETVRVWDAVSGELLETVPRGPIGAAFTVASAIPGSEVPAVLYCGNTRAHFSPWGAPAVELGDNVVLALLFTHGGTGRRVAVAALSNGRLHFMELVEPRAPRDEGDKMRSGGGGGGGGGGGP